MSALPRPDRHELARMLRSLRALEFERARELGLESPRHSSRANLPQAPRWAGVARGVLVLCALLLGHIARDVATKTQRIPHGSPAAAFLGTAGAVVPAPTAATTGSSTHELSHRSTEEFDMQSGTRVPTFRIVHAFGPFVAVGGGVLALSIHASAFADTRLVPGEYPTIAEAIASSTDGDTILVAPGTYAPFDIGDKALVVESTGGASVTTIDAGGQATSAVKFGPRSTFASTVRGFTIRTGSGTVFPNNPSGWRAGGGCYIWSNEADYGGAAATIEDCVFIGATGGCGYGAGIWTKRANVAVRRCSFTGLSTQHHGPALSIDSVAEHSVPGEPGMQCVIEDCFIGTSTSFNNGGALIGFEDTEPIFTRVTRSEFAGNSGSYQAGALLTGGAPGSAGGELLVDRCVFRNNNAPQAKSIGIALLQGTAQFKVTLRDSIIADPSVAVRLGTGQLALEGNTVCAGSGAIAGNYANLGGNAWTCPPSVDCDSDGVNDLYSVTLGTVADIDGNGVPDSCQPTCDDADLDGNGVVYAEDLAMVLNAWGTDGGKFPATDINGDGMVDAVDVASLLNFWGVCP